MHPINTHDGSPIFFNLHTEVRDGMFCVFLTRSCFIALLLLVLKLETSPGQETDSEPGHRPPQRLSTLGFNHRHPPRISPFRRRSHSTTPPRSKLNSPSPSSARPNSINPTFSTDLWERRQENGAKFPVAASTGIVQIPNTASVLQDTLQCDPPDVLVITPRLISAPVPIAENPLAAPPALLGADALQPSPVRIDLSDTPMKLQEISDLPPLDASAEPIFLEDRQSGDRQEIVENFIEDLPDTAPVPSGHRSDWDRAKDNEPDVYNGSRVDNTATELWWDKLVTQPTEKNGDHWIVGVNELLAFFMKNSPKMRSIQLVRESSKQTIIESRAEFDPTVYVESKFARTNDPIGNRLTTGGDGRFLDDDFMTRSGYRKKNHLGGYLNAYQELGLQRNNSDFFVPPDQGTSLLSLNYTQPLMNGRGKIYNESLIAIAQYQQALATQEARQDFQAELATITQQYWSLYSFRSILFQKQENVRRAEEIYTELRLRREIDVSKTQLLRAEAAVATRKAALIKAVNDVKNIGIELSASLGIDPSRQNFEYVPLMSPVLIFPKVDVRDAFVTALEYRPEILQASEKVRIAAEKADRSRHEVLPILDLLLTTYVSGLDERFRVGSALGRQFSDGGPGYSAGLNFEVPLHRRAARARMTRDDQKWQAITADFEDQVLAVQAEVDIAVRSVESSYRNLRARELSTRSAQAEVNAQRERMEISLGDADNLASSLNFLLDAQDRLADEENALAVAQADYMLSWIALKRSMGTLIVDLPVFQADPVDSIETIETDQRAPETDLDHPPVDPPLPREHNRQQPISDAVPANDLPPTAPTKPPLRGIRQQPQPVAVHSNDAGSGNQTSVQQSPLQTERTLKRQATPIASSPAVGFPSLIDPSSIQAPSIPIPQ